jgi:CRISPR-associated endonuclease Csn1
VRDKLFEANPYQLRSRAALEKVSLYEIGRSLWHISKHRGFKSNRKADRSDDDSGLINSASAALLKKLGTYNTYGSFLWARMQAGEGVRVRALGENANKHYEFYPTREILSHEFDTIWDFQKAHHPELTDALRKRLRDFTIFYQRDLKPVLPGRCTFFPSENRLPRWHTAAQEFLILQQLANIRITRGSIEEPLNQESRIDLFNILNSGTKLTWTKVRRLLKLSSDDEINLQSGGLKELHFNQVSAIMVGTAKKPGPLEKEWKKFSQNKKESLLDKLADSENSEELMYWLKTSLKLSEHQAKKVERLLLPQGYIRFCKKVAMALVVEMQKDAIDYAEAVLRTPVLSGIDISHSDLRQDEGLPKLPKYNELPVLQRMIGNGTNNPEDPDDQRLGKITNPTVHIALGQFRRVINMLIHQYGKPDQIVLESARELNKSPKEKKEIKNLIKSNTARNDRFRKELEEEKLLIPGQKIGDRFLKMRLWEELGKTPADRCSPFTGRPISLAELHSDLVEIEHILPFAETFDDSPANKTLAFRGENSQKNNMSPGDAAAIGIFDQDEMIQRTKHLPRNKAWRFLPNAMQIFEEQKSFDDRQLHATSYLARVVRAYAGALFDKTDSDGIRRDHVWMLPGRITAMLRHRWGLNLGDHNRKDRNDHRHHAVDAAVIGVIDRAMIKRLQDSAKIVGTATLSRVFPNPPEPFPNFRNEVLAGVKEINVSHRAKHGSADPQKPWKTSGRLHEDTAMGQVQDIPENQADLTIGNLVVRKPTTSLSDKEIKQVRDLKLRLDLEDATKPARKAGLKKSESEKIRLGLLAEWAKRTGHHRLRIIKKEASATPVFNKVGEPYKYYKPGEVSFVDIIEFGGRWHGHGVSVWGANAGQTKKWTDVWPGGKFIMRIHKGDTIQLFDWDDENEKIVAGSNQIKRVVRLSPSNNLFYLCGINDAGSLNDRHNDTSDMFRWDFAGFDKQRLRRARRVRIDELGRIHTVPYGQP